MAIMTRELSAACRLGRDPVEVGRAREMARKALPGWGIAEHTGLAELIVSELVTNAVLHGRPPIELRVHDAGDRLLLEVHDNSASAPRLRHAGPTDQHGRGLMIVSLLSERWGTRTTRTGKSVWCQLRLS